MALVTSEVYLVSSLENTVHDGYSLLEYHKKYLHEEGLKVEHNYHSGVYVDYICLYFPKLNEVDWFHKDDLSRSGTIAEMD